MQKSSSARGSMLLLLTAFIWGIAFVAQSVGMDYVGPFTFNGVRSLLGGAVLLPCIWMLDKISGRKPSVWGAAKTPQERKMLLFGGVSCGLVLAVASSMQQIGISYTSVGKAGFLTALYIVIVPVLGIFLKKRVGMGVWGSVALALAGMYLLCINETFSVGVGDMFIIASACIFSIHILIIDRFAPSVDCVRMSCIQFAVCGVCCGAFALVFEKPTFASLGAAWLPLAYAGILSCAVAYTLQVVGQKSTPPTLASLILSLESVFAVLAGWVLLGQTLTLREGVGCALVFFAILLAQLPAKKTVKV